MKKLFLIAILALFSANAMAQNGGIDFTSGTLSELQAKAASEEKLIFIDVYATWCGPCKFLSSEIFPDPKVGKYMNANFINAKFDAEQGEGIEIAQQFNVRAYPTMLILNAKGEEVGRVVGIERTPDAFINKIRTTIE